MAFFSQNFRFPMYKWREIFNKDIRNNTHLKQIFYGEALIHNGTIAGVFPIRLIRTSCYAYFSNN